MKTITLDELVAKVEEEISIHMPERTLYKSIPLDGKGIALEINEGVVVMKILPNTNPDWSLAFIAECRVKPEFDTGEYSTEFRFGIMDVERHSTINSIAVVLSRRTVKGLDVLQILKDFGLPTLHE